MFGRRKDPVLGRVDALELRRGDTVVVQITKHMSGHQLNNVMDTLSRAFPENKVVVFEEGVGIHSILREDLDA